MLWKLRLVAQTFATTMESELGLPPVVSPLYL